MSQELARPVRRSIRKTATCRCGEQIILRSRSSRFTKLARRHPWFHAATLKEQCEPIPQWSGYGLQWLQPLEPVALDPNTPGVLDFP